MNAQEPHWDSVMGMDRLPTHIIDKSVPELLDLTGRKAIVTGAGGDGLGQATAHRLAGCGADVALVGRTLEKVERRAAEVEKKWGVRAVPILADLSDWDEVHRAVRESKDALGGLDIMVNNPVMSVAGAFEQHTKAEIDMTVLGSLSMVMYGAHAALEHMVPQGRGRIINISAVGGRVQQKGLTTYCACKAGVIGFTRNLAHEFAPRGINVLGVAPGIMVKPDMLRYVTEPRDDRERAARTSIATSLERYVQLGRVGLPEEVANMVAYLASEAADYMCGQTIDVAGGIWMG
ncbi:SDR family NAD(P)-dependent oxidoreductase [Streptomyces sp. NPDC048282]|uniref:SDR family NAD(P)-dependent oxidoreductase n=1 Tax=Streptomyces sp. NPDC048282 TaxID=3365528 RepID=UPI00370FC4B4